MTESRVDSHVRRLASGKLTHVTAHGRKRSEVQSLTFRPRGYRFPTTPTEEDVFEVIVAHWRDFGVGPTIAEIERQLGWNGRANIVKYLDDLEDQGLIARPLGPKAARGITLPEVSKMLKESLSHNKRPLK